MLPADTIIIQQISEIPDHSNRQQWHAGIIGGMVPSNQPEPSPGHSSGPFLLPC
jgi:hypothetical protein